MISCVEWIPRGAADPHPKRYELSRAERELLDSGAVEEMEKALMAEGGEGAAEEGDDADDDAPEAEDESEDTPVKKKEEGTTTVGGATEGGGKIALPKADIASLPADLRMDEYSDDEDGGGGGGAEAKARLAEQIMGEDSEMLGDYSDAEDGDDGKKGEDAPDGAKDADVVNGRDPDDSDSDSDDDLADVPDTREFAPTSVAGLSDMKLGGADIMADFEDADDDVEDDASDLDDTNLKPTDRLLLVAKAEDDFATLEVHVYEPDSGNLYVHHDIPLPSFPLCLAHGDIGSDGGAGNFCAVGTFDRGIEVWNMDVLNALEPSFVLGGEDGSMADEMMMRGVLGGAGGTTGGGGGKKKKKKGKKGRLPPPPGLRPGSHTGAVMSLSWNKVHRQVLASGSADSTVKVWDVTRADNPKDNPCAATFTHHRDKVQSVAWHPSEGTVLATGGFDRTVCLVDARTPDAALAKRAKLPADCESIAWDPHRQQFLSAASEDGTVSTWDVRQFENGPVHSFVAHEFGGVSDLSYSPKVPGLMATCAIDKHVKLWDCHSPDAPSSIPPHPCGMRDMKVGKIHTLNFYPDSPWLVGCGGSGNTVALWEIGGDEGEGTSMIRNRFGSRIVHNPGGTDERSIKEEEGEPPKKEEDFEAVMKAGDEAAKKAREGAAGGGVIKRKGKKKKKKAHRKGQ